LRRTRRRSTVDRVLQWDRIELRELFAVPCSCRATRGSASSVESRVVRDDQFTSLTADNEEFKMLGGQLRQNDATYKSAARSHHWNNSRWNNCRLGRVVYPRSRSISFQPWAKRILSGGKPPFRTAIRLAWVVPVKMSADCLLVELNARESHMRQASRRSARLGDVVNHASTIVGN